MWSSARPGRQMRGSVVAAVHERHSIGTWGVVAFTVCAAAPLTVVAGSAATGFAVTGYVGVPIAYLTVGAVLALFSVGYVAMARHLPLAGGGFYTYISQGLGAPAGVAAAAVAQLGYNTLQISLYGGAGVVAASIGRAALGWDLPWWAYAVGIWVLIATLGQLSVTVNKRILAILLTAEVAIILVVDTALLTHPAGGALDWTALHPGQLLQPQAGAILVGGIAGYVGYESGVVFSQHARDPRHTISRATYLALALIALVYGLSAWAMTVAGGPEQVVAAARQHGTDLYFTLATGHLPAWLLDTGRMLLATSLIAALLAFHNMIARQAFALGREGVLPPGWGRTGRRTGAPTLASGAQSLLALAVIVTYAAMGWDPITHLFFALGVTGGLGVLVLMTATNAAVIRYFATRPGLEPARRRLIAPLAAMPLLTLILAATLIGFADLLGVPEGSPLRFALPGSYLIMFAAAAAWAARLRRRQPHVYAAIGHGPDSPLPPPPRPKVAADPASATSRLEGPRR